MRNAFALLALGLVLLAGVAQAGSETPAAPLDLNRATAVELEALPGIGEVKAAAILAVRDARGGFESLDELESVRGIGPSLAAKLRPLLKLGARPSQAGARTAKK
jgi:competence protein ComEA